MISNAKLNEYMSKKKPRIHVAWRHNIKLTNAKTYLWCHDLITPSCEVKQNFNKMMVLSSFHKDYVKSIQGISEDKFYLTRNGINPLKFGFDRKEKNPNKLVWMSSPDRGLERAIGVVELAREHRPELELHVYYGLDNLFAAGGHLAELAQKLQRMMDERPWVKYHGFTEQAQMYHDVSDAVIWVHPCNFIETFCITAIEMIALGIYPLTRNLGALANTLAEFKDKGEATLLDIDCVTEQEYQEYASTLLNLLDEKAWERIKSHVDNLSWGSVADEWIQEMQLT